MNKLMTTLLGAMCICGIAAVSANAAQYPPGPGGLCPDSVTITQIQNTAAACHPALNDSVYGVAGIVTALDTKTSGVGFYLQNSQGGPYTGINVFTANTIWPFAIGDSVRVHMGQYIQFNLDPELTALNGSFGAAFSASKISSGNALPPFQTGNTTFFNQLPTNPNMTPYLGGLVKLTGPVRVARTVGVGTTNFVVVDNTTCPTGSVGPCDSVFVDGGTLPNPSVTQPAFGTIAQSISGVAGRNATTFRIRMRLTADLEAAVPPNVVEAYSLADDTVRIVFDRPVTSATAQDINNYSLASFGTVNSATLEASGKHVRLSITNGVGHGFTETVLVQNLIAADSGLPMGGTQQATFWNGVTPVSIIRAPDPTYLAGAPCVDRSRFSGTGTTVGAYPVTFRAVCTAAFPGGNPIYYVQDNSAATRCGFAQYGPLAPMVPGHQYLIVAKLQEFNGETEGVYESYLRDEGVASVQPVALDATILAVKDSTCDVTQSQLTGMDFLGQLVKFNYVSSMYTNNAGSGFNVKPLGGADADSIHITHKSGSTWTFVADSLMTLDVTGVVSYSFGVYTVLPRYDSDMVSHGINTGVPTTLPSKVAFSVMPNPARTSHVTFALPVKNTVDVSVFDLSGRKIATLAHGSFDAGTYSRTWNGTDASGHSVGSGMYFYRMQVGTETYTLRGIKLD